MTFSTPPSLLLRFGYASQSIKFAQEHASALRGSPQVPEKYAEERVKKTELLHSSSVEFAKLKPATAGQSYERGTTLAACSPFGPSSTENSTFCSASNFR